MTSVQEEIARRRTFAIISHPDAGKTTLTEKFLLYSGTINTAGSVKGKATAKHAVSDWMEIEKQRGISVTSSVLQFEYEGCCVNLLDTPGHQDFSEDTYRTLMAADSAVMVIDGSKGVEPQTRKLFKVCAMRHIPIFTFINKMDRDALDTFDLLDDIEKNLGVSTCPVNWPIGSGKGFKGIYDRELKDVLIYTDTLKGTKEGKEERIPLSDDAAITAAIGENAKEKLESEIDLLDGASEPFDLDEVQQGLLTPVFFGSALQNFGVEMANMNKAHRDRVAFIRVCSGRYDATQEVKHVQSGRVARLSQPQQLMADDRKVVSEAYAGDILGIFDPGLYSIGDTFCMPKQNFRYEGIPTFAPEHFARVRQVDTMKRDQFVKGISQIAQEGAIQIFREIGMGLEEIICGVVGVLQFDVLKFRLKNEYNVDIILEQLPYEYIRWISKWDGDVKNIVGTSDMKLIEDLKGNPLLIFVNEWSVGMVLDRNKGLELEEFRKN